MYMMVLFMYYLCNKKKNLIKNICKFFLVRGYWCIGVWYILVYGMIFLFVRNFYYYFIDNIFIFYYLFFWFKLFLNIECFYRDYSYVV